MPHECTVECVLVIGEDPQLSICDWFMYRQTVVIGYWPHLENVIGYQPQEEDMIGCDSGP